MAIYCSCLLCHATLASSQINNHYGAKTCIAGGKIKKLSSCPHCGISSSDISDVANHVRWCNSNPNLESYTSRGNSHMITSQAIAKKRATLVAKYSEGKIDIAKSRRKSVETRRANGTLGHSIETRQKLSSHPNCHVVRNTHKFTDKHGRVFNFDSSWEDAFAVRLDELDIHWTRPEPVKWVDSAGNTRRYYADFLLLDYDLYVDPKNSFVQSTQTEKLMAVSKMIKLKIIPSLCECKTFTLCDVEEWANGKGLFPM